jgi:uncharacterized protein HemY
MLDQRDLRAAETAVEQFTELDAAHKHVVDLRKQAGCAPQGRRGDHRVRLGRR